MKKLCFVIALFLLTCALFSPQIVGVGIRLVLNLKYDCGLAYRSCKWDDGQLIFSDLVLFDPSFHAHIERVGVRFDWSSFPKKIKGHITIDAPHLTIKRERALPQGSSQWFDFSIAINNGLFDWGGEVQFSLYHNSYASQISLDWADASAFVTFHDGKCEASCNRFYLPLINKWLPLGKILDGLATGRFAIDLEGNLSSSNLKIARGAFDLGSGVLDGVNGSFSYNTSLGAKWEFDGFGKTKGDPFPFSCSGRRFFNNHWLESKICFEEAVCTIAKDDAWTIECDSIRACEATLFQSVLAYFYPELACWKIESGIVSGKMVLSLPIWQVHFNAHNVALQKNDYILSCSTALGNLSDVGGNFAITAPECQIAFDGKWDDWNAKAEIGGARLTLKGGWDGEKLPMTIESGTFADLQFVGKGWINTDLDGAFSLDGSWQFLEKQIPFYCPIVSKSGQLWMFDFRCARQTWDFFRISGLYDGEKIEYLPTSHFLGQSLFFTQCKFNEIDFSLELPWSAVVSAHFLFKEWGLDLHTIPELAKTTLHVQYKEGLRLTAKGSSPPFVCHIAQKAADWEMDLKSDLTASAVLQPDGMIKGFGKWKESCETQFEGKIDPKGSFALSLSNSLFDLKTIDWLNMEGIATGCGHLIYDGAIEADFDFDLSSLTLHSFPLENEGQIHLFYSSKKGALLRGLHLHGALDCVVDLLHYDTRSHWIFHNAQFHIPAHLLHHPSLPMLDQDKDLNLTANLDFASDFSSLVCTMREGSIPYQGSYYDIENLNLIWNSGKCVAHLRYMDHPFRIDMQIGDKIEGRISVGNEMMPLTVDWEYKEDLFIRSIEGAFSGLDASFHAERPNVLVGSARLNFSALQSVLPADVAIVFDEIKMGQGYELKGRLKIENNRPDFQGILSGKAIELFGFQFRTLLAQVDLKPERLRIYDVKISDSAGMMKIDELLIEDHNPWMVEIPNLTILDLRPSLLQRPGEAVGPISPLVVRELKINDFKGVLDDGKTYTAKGQLHFINSYKREETVFDLPANVLSRIVGLDLELLIPVVGDLNFEIKDGYFNLLELKNAYSEGKRSQFFLEMEPPPRMDLDGNLEIYIKMKQFVLLKITESFLISIDGVLDDPQYRLKRKRFFGFM